MRHTARAARQNYREAERPQGTQDARQRGREAEDQRDKKAWEREPAIQRGIEEEGL